MLNKIALFVVVLLLLAPTLGLTAVALVVNPALNAECTIQQVSLGDVPEELEVTTADGETFVLNERQLTHAATIIRVGSAIDEVGRPGMRIALMAALAESTLRMLSNTTAYPDSGDYPNDGDGGDHDSLGLFQMRPQYGWGTVEQLMDPDYQARAFYGGEDGPNYPSPQGLLDIDGWEQMTPGEAAQAVEDSRYPDRYENFEPVADTIIDALTTTASRGTTNVVFPLPDGTWNVSSPFGWRFHEILRQWAFHAGIDLGAGAGTPILAAADGTVTHAGFSGGYGGLIVIEHEINGETVATAYGHMWENGIHAAVGDRVTAGQHIGDVGSAGRSSGPHLHFEVRLGGSAGEVTDPASWLNEHNAADLPEPEGSAPELCEATT